MAFGLFCIEHGIGADDMIHVVCTSHTSKTGLYDSKLVSFGLKYFHHNAGLIEKGQHCSSWLYCMNFTTLKTNKFLRKCWGPFGPQCITQYRKHTIHVSTTKLCKKFANYICDNYQKEF